MNFDRAMFWFGILSIPLFIFGMLPFVGLTLEIWGYHETAKSVLLAFFDVLAWTGGLN